MATMATTSQKHRNFVLEPMGSKPVTQVAGIGVTYGKRLSEEGYDKAYVLLGQFLVLKKNQRLFIEWFKSICGANANHAAACYKCLMDWCTAFL